LNCIGLDSEPKLTSIFSSIHRLFFNRNKNNDVFNVLFYTPSHDHHDNDRANTYEKIVAHFVDEAWQKNISLPVSLRTKEEQLHQMPTTAPHNARYLNMRHATSWCMLSTTGFAHWVEVYISALWVAITGRHFPDFHSAWLFELQYVELKLERQVLGKQDRITFPAEHSMNFYIVRHFDGISAALAGVRAKLSTLNQSSNGMGSNLVSSSATSSAMNVSEDE
jgi:hypothetical protein